MFDNNIGAATYYYRVYGLNIKSNKFIPFLPALPDMARCDLAINIVTLAADKHPHPYQGMQLVYSSSSLKPGDAPFLAIWHQPDTSNGPIMIQVNNECGTATFTIDPQNSLLHIYMEGIMLMDDILGYLLGLVMGCVLKSKAIPCLHAAVVNINNHAVLFIGNKGAGKSVLTATLAAAGIPVVSDDVAALIKRNDSYYVAPGYPCLRIWQNMVGQIAGVDHSSLKRVLPGIDKYFFPLQQDNLSANWNFEHRELELRSIYFLNERNSTGRLSIKKMPNKDSLMYLLANTYAYYIFNQDISVSNFTTFTHLASIVGVKELEQPDDIHRIGQTCKLLIADNG